MGCGSSSASNVQQNEPMLRQAEADTSEGASVGIHTYREDKPNVFFLVGYGEDSDVVQKETIGCLRGWYAGVDMIDYREFISSPHVVSNLKTSFPSYKVENLSLLNDESRKEVDRHLAVLLVMSLMNKGKGSRIGVYNYPLTPSEFTAFEHANSLVPIEGDELDKDPSIREAARRRSLVAEGHGLDGRVCVTRHFVLSNVDDVHVLPVIHMSGRHGTLRRIPALLPSRAANLVVESAPSLFTSATFSNTFFVSGCSLNGTTIVAEKMAGMLRTPHVIDLLSLPDCQNDFNEAVDAEVAVRALLEAIPRSNSCITAVDNVVIANFPQSVAQWVEWQQQALKSTFTKCIIRLENTRFDRCDDIELALKDEFSVTYEDAPVLGLNGDCGVLGSTLARNAQRLYEEDAQLRVAQYSVVSTELSRAIAEEPSCEVLTMCLGSDLLEEWLKQALFNVGSAPVSEESEVTCAIIKPDGTALEATNAILRIVRETGFEIVMDQLRTVTEDDTKMLYRKHQNKPFFKSLIEYMAGGPCTVLILKAPGAVALWNRLLGCTDSNRARLLGSNFVRSMYGQSVLVNAAHGSRSSIQANEEIRTLFNAFPAEHLNSENHMSHILISGPPASGKGTQAEYIVEFFKKAHISTGDLLRTAKEQGSTIGLEAASYFENGKLVPDTVMIPLVMEHVKQLEKEQKSVLLDGFPRTGDQALALKEANFNPAIFLVIDVKDAALVERVSGRRMHKETKQIYHLTFSPPPEGTPADMLLQREDDTEEKVKGRIHTYKTHVRAIAAQFGNKLCFVNGEQHKSEVFKNYASFL